jgi:excisionase family DNA binding protein
MTDSVRPGDAARRLGVSTRTVQRWLREGRLQAVNVGSHVRVAASSLPNDGPVPGGSRRAITRLLVANRGELVVRIARTCRQLGITSLALVAEDQARAWWVSGADEIVPLAGTYLDADAVLRAARDARADAIHPGYGFLAENADFAEAVIAAGIAWIGPPPDAMRALGDKAAARKLAERLGVPVLTGYDGADQTDARLTREAKKIGFPVLAKPSAGGGGKGMHVIESARGIAETLARARREATAAFGDDRLILERYLARPRHIEVQILADAHGNAVHLGERECSLQRRHQKVIEESPSPAVTPKLRQQLGEAALKLVREAGYTGAGTAEFLLTPDGEFFFLEVNARLQVEHPVTELVTGRDLVADQISIASGAPLDFTQSDVTLTGHAIEARLYAEDPFIGFLPAAGLAAEVRWPTGEAIRVDAGIGQDDMIETRYDPLLAKLIARGSTRTEALDNLSAALDQTAVLGVTTNRGFLEWLISDPDVASGAMYTTLIDERWRPSEELPESVWNEAAIAIADGRDELTGFRLNARRRMRIQIDGEHRDVDFAGRWSTWRRMRLFDPEGAVTGVMLDLDGRSIAAVLARAPTVESALRRSVHEGASSEQVKAPMPGSVLAIRVSEGDEVAAGQVLLVLEAMKMENTVLAPSAGTVKSVFVTAGQQVKRGETLVELA